MIGNYSYELAKQYMPYVVFDDSGDIIAFTDNAPESAKQAAKEHIKMSQKFDDISNFDHWEELLTKLGLE